MDTPAKLDRGQCGGQARDTDDRRGDVGAVDLFNELGRGVSTIKDLGLGQGLAHLRGAARVRNRELFDIEPFGLFDQQFGARLRSEADDLDRCTVAGQVVDNVERIDTDRPGRAEHDEPAWACSAFAGWFASVGHSLTCRRNADSSSRRSPRRVMGRFV